MNDLDRVSFSVAECVAALGVSESTIRRWTKSGELPATKIGGRLLVHSQGLVDRLLIARGDADAIREQRQEQAADVEARRLSHTAHETKEDWLARLTSRERAEYDEQTAAARADHEHRTDPALAIRYA